MLIIRNKKIEFYKRKEKDLKTLLIIAGSDSSGGAGIQADIKTAEAFGVFSTTAITVLTAQNTTGVKSIEPVPVGFLHDQIEMIMSDFRIDAIKIGMLFNKELISSLGSFLERVNLPVVLDPVFLSKAGANLLEIDAVEELKKLFKYATLITPNQKEAIVLFGKELRVDAPSPVLIKHFVKNGHSLDRLYYPDGKVVDFESLKLETKNLHGSGCSYSTAIASNLALGKSLEEAIKISKKFIYEAILNAPNLGKGPGPLAHKIGGNSAT